MKWIIASKRMPRKNKTHRFNLKIKNDPVIGDLIIRDGKKTFDIPKHGIVEQDRLFNVEWLDETKSPTSEGWVSEKPKWSKKCILLTASWFNNHWEYQSYTVEQIEGFNKTGNSAYYWGLICSDGEEWGDIVDLKADMYLVLPLLAQPSKE